MERDGPTGTRGSSAGHLEGLTTAASDGASLFLKCKALS